ncbi:transposase [Streptomyces sp. NBC_01744]|nr:MULTISPECIES: transposase [unclassified Streptomyces]WSC49653.1 transposase [Streptomyces sp. NBC_01762]WSC51591.1 transposase [Streptomyces sp. NBC_01761]WSF82440.1 transposase [Streptomyces sp. NBC_01744]
MRWSHRPEETSRTTPVCTCGYDPAASNAAEVPLPRAADGRLVLAIDVTCWLRPHAHTSPQRILCHTYGRGKGQHAVRLDMNEDLTRMKRLLRLRSPGGPLSAYGILAFFTLR